MVLQIEGIGGSGAKWAAEIEQNRAADPFGGPARSSGILIDGARANGKGLNNMAVERYGTDREMEQRRKEAATAGYGFGVPNGVGKTQTDAALRAVASMPIATAGRDGAPHKMPAGDALLRTAQNVPSAGGVVTMKEKRGGGAAACFAGGEPVRFIMPLGWRTCRPWPLQPRHADATLACCFCRPTAAISPTSAPDHGPASCAIALVRVSNPRAVHPPPQPFQ